MSEPGWGRPHVHEFRPVRAIGVVTIRRCECGAPGPALIGGSCGAEGFAGLDTESQEEED